jgi:hypothetical protein
MKIIAVNIHNCLWCIEDRSYMNILSLQSFEVVATLQIEETGAQKG